MRRTRRISYVADPSAARIQRLENEVYFLRIAVVDLAPAEFHGVLTSYDHCATRTETYAWLDETANAVAQRADILPLDAIFGQRAHCPLCRGGSSSFYGEPGFSIPEGLRRHLVGFGKVRQCVVAKAAADLARDSWNSSFAKAETLEEERKRTDRARRLKTETVYVIGPSGDHVLQNDTDAGWFHEPRLAAGSDDFSFSWAVARVLSLGFDEKVDGRARAYTKLHSNAAGSFIVYADPRFKGEIEFRIFKNPWPKGRASKIPVAVVTIRDAWKNDLQNKLALKLDERTRRSGQAA